MSKKAGKKKSSTSKGHNKKTAQAEEMRQKALAAKKKAERQARLKKAGIIFVCVALIVALGIPTVAISVLMS